MTGPASGAPARGERVRYRVRHRTTYRYAQAAQRILGLLRLKPRPCPGQVLEAFQLRLAPSGGRLEEHVDPFGNPCALTEWSRPQNALTVEVVFQVRRDWPEQSLMASTPLTDLPQALCWQPAFRALADPVSRSDHARHPLAEGSPALPASTAEWLDAALYRVEVGPPGAGRAVLAALDLDPLPTDTGEWTVLALADALAARIPARFAYVPGATTVETSIDDLLRDRRGVCQDFAHLAVAAARALGVPARYVSGYLETRPPPGQPRLRGVDATHAWVSLYDPALGWIDIDPTNACRCDQRHVTLAWGRGYSDVAPVTGVMQGGVAAGLEVAVDVERLGVEASGPSADDGLASWDAGRGALAPIEQRRQ